jgi:hypothetical protein
MKKNTELKMRDRRSTLLFQAQQDLLVLNIEKNLDDERFKIEE